jgi:hypothetical protein
MHQSGIFSDTLRGDRDCSYRGVCESPTFQGETPSGGSVISIRLVTAIWLLDTTDDSRI